MLAALERLLSSAAALGGTIDAIAHPELAGRRFPVYALRFGNPDAAAPRLIVVGGVHGLERIGTEVALAFLTTFLAQLRWDRLLAGALARCRVVFVPLVNPVGMALHTRANGNGVDLMRNAPSHPDWAATPTLLVGGQRASSRLPWFSGRRGDPMELEATALCELVEAETFASRFALALDLHSGFGMIDRLWFPYARTMHPLPHLAEVRALSHLLDTTLPNHVYRMEPTARAYRIRGDLWDHLYDRRRIHGAGGGLFLPLTLEMGSWSWMRKNPRQLFSRLGSFNPIKPHRLRRTLRRHLPLFDVLLRACVSADAWALLDDAARPALEREARAAWFQE